jgi:hypothetical protein
MSIVDNAVKANRNYAKKHDPSPSPTRGFVFDMETVLRSEVGATAQKSAA